MTRTSNDNAGSVDHPQPGAAHIAWVVAALLGGLLQIALLPLVSAGRTFTLAGWLVADTLSITFGSAWLLTLALLLILNNRVKYLAHGRPSLMVAGFLMLAYSGNAVVLAAGLLITWLAIYNLGRSMERHPARAVLFCLLVVVPLLFGEAGWRGLTEFLPPSGGTGEAWLPFSPVVSVAAALMLATLLSPSWPLHVADRLLPAMYTLVTPYLLLKTLVAAPWQPVTGWFLVLLGSLVALVATYQLYSSKTVISYQVLLAGVAVVGLGLAPLSSLGAAGAVWVLLAGLLSCVAITPAIGWQSSAIGIIASVPGVWLILQAALNTGYGAIVPFIVFTFVISALTAANRGGYFLYSKAKLPAWMVVIIGGFALVFPQAAIQEVIAPVIGSLAGGVSVLTGLEFDWGVGVALRLLEGPAAALPATAIAALALIAASILYWLKQLAAHFAVQGEHGDKTE